MNFYTISTGEYSDYNYTKIYHERNFSRQEFIEMYNEAIKVNDRGDEDIADVLCEKYGFIKVEDELEINADYGPFHPITKDYIINGEHKFIRAGEDY
jgi:hypothetical protein